MPLTGRLFIQVDETGNVVESFGLSQLIDYDGGASPIYMGWTQAGLGLETDKAVWKIAKLGYDGTDLISKLWAEGNTRFEHIWDDRASLNYS